MHVGVRIAPSYKQGISQANEINLSTVATSRTDDHWSGLNTILCSGYYTGDCEEQPAGSIASQFNDMVRSKTLKTASGAEVPVDPAACFDLAAARGIRGGRAKCAYHTTAETSEDRHSVPELAQECEWEEEESGDFGSF